MALFIDLREYPRQEEMKRHVFLTKKYSKKELARKLRPLVDEYNVDKFYVNRVLQEGEVLQKDCIIELKGETVLTTQARGTTWYYGPKDKLTIHPDGTWDVEYYEPWWRKVDALYEKKKEALRILEV